jgi:hypothetical protein
MLELVNTFHGRVISRHRKASAAARAEHRYQRAFARTTTAGSFMPTDVRGFRSEAERAEFEQETDRLKRASRPVRRLGQS